MELKKITREEEYDAALERFEEIMFAEEGTKEDNEAYLLGLVLEAYETENFPIEEPDPIAYIDSRLGALGLKRKNLVNIIAASESHVSDIMNKRRALSLEAIRKLGEDFNMDTNVLMQRYELTCSKLKRQPRKSRYAHGTRATRTMMHEDKSAERIPNSKSSKAVTRKPRKT
jgi:HTH-type transcriptional regulator/antitoxin HigA